jgi:hypothetical protein
MRAAHYYKTMRSIYFHLIGGASGDMLLSCLINLGFPVTRLKREVSKLFPLLFKKNKIKIGFKKVKRGHFIKRKLYLENKSSLGFPLNYKGIVELIKKSYLQKDIKERALEVYKVIYDAEKKVHNVKGDLHFHHLGNLDAILEICGFFVGLKYLKIEKTYVSSFPLGNPAPATLEILKNKRIRAVDFDYETVTPTAAGLLSRAEQTDIFLSHFYPDGKEYKNYALGWGNFGKKDYLLAYLLEDELLREKIIKIETNIDDMNPQIFEYLFEGLYREGAKEVYIEQVVMKKSRPAFVLNVLCDQKDFSKLRDLIFSSTSTFGIRYQEYWREKLNYKFIYKNTKWGRVKFRVSGAPFKKEIPEYGDCLRMAKRLKTPLLEVYRRIQCF